MLRHSVAQSRPSIGFYPPMPMIIETVEQAIPTYEYHVVEIDPREAGAIDPEYLNTLGKEGWLLASVIESPAGPNRTFIHYYFVRGAREDKKEAKA